MQNDPSLPLVVNVVGQSPHVFAYKFWSKSPGQLDWTVIKEGQTEDEIPDSFATGPHQDGTRIAYWAGAGGRKNSDFQVAITFSQQDRIIVGGLDVLTGRTSDSGAGIAQSESILI